MGTVLNFLSVTNCIFRDAQKHKMLHRSSSSKLRRNCQVNNSWLIGEFIRSKRGTNAIKQFIYNNHRKIQGGPKVTIHTQPFNNSRNSSLNFTKISENIDMGQTESFWKFRKISFLFHFCLHNVRTLWARNSNVCKHIWFDNLSEFPNFQVDCSWLSRVMIILTF